MNSRDKSERGAAFETWLDLSHGFGSLMDIAERCTSGFGLTLPQFQVLEILGRLQPLSQTELGENLLSSAGNISQIVGNLQRKELICRVRDPSDRRFRVVTLTPRGERAFAAAFPAFLAVITRELAGLSGEQQTALRELAARFAPAP